MDLSKSYEFFDPSAVKGRVHIVGCGSVGSSLAENIASDFHLLSSGGSDFHGSVKPDISLGTGKGWLCIPQKIYADLLAAWKNL